jgi:hypothetical protein
MFGGYGYAATMNVHMYRCQMVVNNALVMVAHEAKQQYILQLMSSMVGLVAHKSYFAKRRLSNAIFLFFSHKSRKVLASKNGRDCQT